MLDDGQIPLQGPLLKTRHTDLTSAQARSSECYRSCRGIGLDLERPGGRHERSSNPPFGTLMRNFSTEPAQHTCGHLDVGLARQPPHHENGTTALRGQVGCQRNEQAREFLARGRGLQQQRLRGLDSTKHDRPGPLLTRPDELDPGAGERLEQRLAEATSQGPADMNLMGSRGRSAVGHDRGDQASQGARLAALQLLAGLQESPAGRRAAQDSDLGARTAEDLNPGRPQQPQTGGHVLSSGDRGDPGLPLRESGSQQGPDRQGLGPRGLEDPLNPQIRAQAPGLRY